MKLYSYNQGSKSAKSLAEALDIKRIKHEGSRYRPRKGDVVINWGSSGLPDALAPCKILNKPQAVATAVNKLSAFMVMGHLVSMPEWTESRDEAVKWLAEGVTVVARTKLTGHSGEGIHILNKDDKFVEAPLYTKYIPKKAEYRVHVFGDQVFFTQKKARKLDVPDADVNWKVQNLQGGFIYANQNIICPVEAGRQAVLAINALGLDFGAVDIIWNKKENKYYVLEVNTACGLEGTTLDKYVEQFKEVM